MKEVLGFEFCTSVQAAAIPVILEGRDILAKARTGTGKTLGFMLPALQQVRTAPDHAHDALTCSGLGSKPPAGWPYVLTCPPPPCTAGMLFLAGVLTYLCLCALSGPAASQGRPHQHAERERAGAQPHA